MGKRLTEEDIQQIKAIYEEGFSVKDIVEATGKSISSVRRALAGFRVVRKGKKPKPKKPHNQSPSQTSATMITGARSTRRRCASCSRMICSKLTSNRRGL